jgi:hypothetical protein
MMTVTPFKSQQVLAGVGRGCPRLSLDADPGRSTQMAPRRCADHADLDAAVVGSRSNCFGTLPLKST